MHAPQTFGPDKRSTHPAGMRTGQESKMIRDQTDCHRFRLGAPYSCVVRTWTKRQVDNTCPPQSEVGATWCHGSALHPARSSSTGFCQLSVRFAFVPSQDFRSCDLPWERMNMDIRITGNTLRNFWIALALVATLSEVEDLRLCSQPPRLAGPRLEARPESTRPPLQPVGGCPLRDTLVATEGVAI